MKEPSTLQVCLNRRLFLHFFVLQIYYKILIWQMLYTDKMYDLTNNNKACERASLFLYGM